jgi:hypothetical protein
VVAGRSSIFVFAFVPEKENGKPSSYRRLTPSEFRRPSPRISLEPERGDPRGGELVIALILLALIAIVLFGVGFTVHWLFIIAAIVALLWLIAVFTGGIGGRRRGYWY